MPAGVVLGFFLIFIFLLRAQNSIALTQQIDCQWLINADDHWGNSFSTMTCYCVKYLSKIKEKSYQEIICVHSPVATHKKREATAYRRIIMIFRFENWEGDFLKPSSLCKNHKKSKASFQLDHTIGVSLMHKQCECLPGTSHMLGN